MTIILTGGGSGGHITPVLAVAAELKRLNPKAELVYIGQKGDSLGDIPAKDPNIDKIYNVRAGKFRRFHGEGIRQLFDIVTVSKNFRDIFYVIIGAYQSWRIIRRLKPQVVFSRGSYVSVPVAVGARLCHVPFITHDSDLIPSLANRLIARWARVHAVAFSREEYPYPPDKTVTTGIPISEHFQKVTDVLKKRYRSELNIPNSARMVFVIGGGLGSREVNNAVSEALPHLLQDFQNLYVVHATGRSNLEDLQERYRQSIEKSDQHRLQVHAYINDVYRYSGAADVVVTRAGATNLAEFAVQGKACIVIPSSFLAGGHQLKNAEYLVGKGAARVLTQEDLIADPNRLAVQITTLLRDAKLRKRLGQTFEQLAHPDASHKIAQLILEQV